MAGPYLKSGESIILTTDRVLLDDIEYDVILTSQRLALVDSGHTGDQPQVIPFATILSVKGGTTPAREPFITLAIIDPIGLEDSRSIDLIFSQQPYEDRAGECDNWVKKLIEHIVSVRQEPVPASGKQQVPAKPRGMNSTVRRFVAPEMPLPHSQVAHEIPRPSEKLLSDIQDTVWETPENPGVESESDNLADSEEGICPAPDCETELPSPDPVFEGNSIELSPKPAELADADAPRENTEVPGPALTLEVNSPTPVQEMEPVKTIGRPDPVSVPATPFDELVPRGAKEGQEFSVPATPDRCPEKEEFQVPEEEPVLPGDEKTETPVPEKRVVDLAEEPDTLSGGKESGEPFLPEEMPEPAGGIVPDHAKYDDLSRSESREQTGLPDTVVFPVLSGTDPLIAPDTPQEKSLPSVQVPALQPPAPQPGKIPVWAMAALILVILAVIGGAAIIFLHPAGNGDEPDHPAITLTPTPQPIVTNAPVAIPGEGVWVKVTYNGTFYGRYGNPGGLKEVRGTGEQIYAIKNTNDLVQATFTKQDDYGNVLTVEVYNNGRMVTQVSKRTPGGTIAILVDPKTGKAPYVPVTTITV